MTAAIHTTDTPKSKEERSMRRIRRAVRGPSLTIVLSLLIACSPQGALRLTGQGGITVDHTNYDPAALPDSDIVKAAALKVYFEHASVGQNICAGLEALKGSSRYSSEQLSLSSAYDSTWFQTHSGLEDNNRGNPGADAKRSYFASSMAAIAPTANVATFKFCWIDNPSSPATLFSAVKATMESLEASYPAVKFVWWTMPITTSDCPDDDAAKRAQRQSYNSLVRNYCAANGKWLLDIAALESHADSGAALVDGSGNELLVQAYSSDGGHLNSIGQNKIAKAYWRLLAEIAAD
jgi:hypothetical protein